MILILSRPTDFHGFFVEEALRRKGGKPLLWHTSDFPQLQSWSIEDEEEQLAWNVRGPGFEWRENPKVIWDRRPGPPVISASIHPADRQFAETECKTFYRWLYLLLPRDSFWVNRPEAASKALSKIVQQKAAKRVGMRVIPTLYSNDPTRIRSFAQRHGEIIYKPFSQNGLWMLPGQGAAALYTARMTQETLSDDDALKATPGIFQPLIPKQHELRITVIGKHVFPAKIKSQEMLRGQLDWRTYPNELLVEPTAIPKDLENAILALMKELGLVFGCLDFIVTPAGDTVFLEVNEMGQFLFIEAYTGIPLLDAFCELLLQARPDFRWESSAAQVSMKDLDELIVQRVAEAEREHIDLPDFFSVEESLATPESSATTSSDDLGV